MSEVEYIQADPAWREYVKSSERAAAARSRLPAGSSRAKVTTANARWARAAEAREARAAWLREQYRKTDGGR